MIFLPDGPDFYYHYYYYLKPKAFTRFISKVTMQGQSLQIHSNIFQSVHWGLLFQRFLNCSCKYYVLLFCVSSSGTQITDSIESYLYIFCLYQFLSDPFYFILLFWLLHLFLFLFSIYFHMLSVIYTILSFLKVCLFFEFLLLVWCQSFKIFDLHIFYIGSNWFSYI